MSHGPATIEPIAAANSESGPEVARLFRVLFSLVLGLAWVSLAVQIEVLVGQAGLAPACQLLGRASEAGLGPLQLPTLFWLGCSDNLLAAGTLVGVLLALLAALAIRPRLCFALTAVLYLSYATVCDDFTAFQWDSMLVETALLASLLPYDRRAPQAHLIFRLLLFKLYLESGIAKWQSHLGDWHDGSAMTFYFETAPLPARLAFHAHHLPKGVLEAASWGALGLELLVPLLIFGPRWAKRTAFLSFTGFQLVNTLTANYGFFTYLSTVLHLFLLADADVLRLQGLVRVPRSAPMEARTESRGLQSIASGVFACWCLASLLVALVQFGGVGRETPAVMGPVRILRGYRVANAYHLFGHITRARIEPQFETRQQGLWTEHDLHYKPGDPTRPPPYVAPHQPRVDFRLWFYGLGFRRGMPAYVDTLLDRMCREPRRVAPLFVQPLPEHPEAVRIHFYRYRYTDSATFKRTGAYWTRQALGALPARHCD